MQQSITVVAWTLHPGNFVAIICISIVKSFIMQLPLIEHPDGQIIPLLHRFVRVLNELNVFTSDHRVGGVSLVNVVNDINIHHLTFDEIV